MASVEGDTCARISRSGRYGLWGFYQKQLEWQKVMRVPGTGRSADRDGVPQFMIAPCQRVNEQSVALY